VVIEEHEDPAPLGGRNVGPEAAQVGAVGDDRGVEPAVGRELADEERRGGEEPVALGNGVGAVEDHLLAELTQGQGQAGGRPDPVAVGVGVGGDEEAIAAPQDLDHAIEECVQPGRRRDRHAQPLPVGDARAAH